MAFVLFYNYCNERHKLISFKNYDYEKVLVALAVVVGLGSSVAFAHVTSEVQSVIQALQDPQDEFTKSK